MAKLSKDDIQKLVLGGMLFIFMIYAYFEFLLTPMSKEVTAMQTEILKVTDENQKADKDIKTARNAEANSVRAGEVITYLTSLSPTGSAIAVLPPRFKQYFSRMNIEDANVRRMGEEPSKDTRMGRWIVTNWTIDMPHVAYIPFGIAIAGFENDFVLSSITKLQISFLPEDLEKQRAQIEVKTLFNQP